MRKYLFLLVAVVSLFITTTASAEKSTINTAIELHNVVVENKLAELDANGKLIVNLQEIKKLNISDEILEEYLVDVEEKLIFFNSNLEIQSYSPQEIANHVFEQGLEFADKNLILPEFFELGVEKKG